MMNILAFESSALALLLVSGFLGGCGGSAPGDPCGPEAECRGDQFCDYQYNWCGQPSFGEDSAQCELRSATCDNDVQVCGCDGAVYPSECAAHEMGIDIGGGDAGQERCAHDLTPPGTFACGPYFCAAAKSYCAYGDGDQGDRSTECKPLPQACGGAGACACVPPPSEGDCTTAEGNGVTGVIVREVWQ